MAKATLLGNVNLFGLNQYGKNPGMSPLAGVGIGAGATFVGGLIAGKISALAGHQGKASAVAGLGSAAALYASKKHRHAALGAALGWFIVQGLPMLASKVGLAGLGIPQINYLNGAGLGVHQIEMLNGGLGLHTLEPTRTPHGTIPGVAGHGMAQAGIQMGSDSGQPPVSLLGESTAQSRQVTSMGGPVISGLSTSYGATLFGTPR